MLSRRFTIIAVSSFLALTLFSGCGGPAGSNQAANGGGPLVSNLPEDQADLVPAPAGDERITGVWREKNGSKSIYIVIEDGQLVLTNLERSYKNQLLVFEMIPLLAGRTPDTWQTHFKLKGGEATDSGFVSVKLQPDGSINLADGVQQGSVGTATLMSRYERDIGREAAARYNRVREIRAMEFLRAPVPCNAVKTGGNLGYSNALEFEEAIKNRNLECVLKILQVVRKPEERKQLANYVSFRSFARETADVQILEVLESAGFVKPADLASMLSELLNFNGWSARGLNSRIEVAGAKVPPAYVSENGFRTELLANLLNRDLPVTDTNAVFEVIERAPYQTAKKVVEAAIAREGRDIWKKEPGIVITLVMRAAYGLIESYSDLQKKIELLVENGCTLADRYSNGSGNLAREVIRTGDIGFYRFMKAKGVVFGASELSSARQLLGEYREGMAKEKRYTDRLDYARLIEEMKALIGEMKKSI